MLYMEILVVMNTIIFNFTIAEYLHGECRSKCNVIILLLKYSNTCREAHKERHSQHSHQP